jgi:hypothetical protein
VSQYQQSALAAQTGMLQLGFAAPTSAHIHIKNMRYGMYQDSQLISKIIFGNNFDLKDIIITLETSALGCDPAALGI